MLIQLTEYEYELALFIASQRQTHNVFRKEAKPRYGAGRNREHEFNIRGVMGELVVAKALNRFYSGACGDFEAKDVSTFQIRTSSKRVPYLILHKPDGPDDIFVHVTEMDGGAYTVTGWLQAGEGQVDGFWCDKYKNKRPAYFVPISRLHSIDTLPDE